MIGRSHDAGMEPKITAPARQAFALPAVTQRLDARIRERRADRGHTQRHETPTYYDQPALKPSLYGWKVSLYMFIGGIAGSAQLLAATADFSGRSAYRGIVGNGRYLALAGATIGPPLLIADLHTPARFYNMLRIFRPTSPMSIGTYVLVGFGGTSAALAGAQLRRQLGGNNSAVGFAARAVQIPAALFGAAMCTYTGALLSATSNPLWAAAPRLIPALFGASAVASGAAALSLRASGLAAQAMEKIEALASAAELLMLLRLARRWRSAGVGVGLPMLPLLVVGALPVVHRIAAAIELPRASPPALSAVGTRRSAIIGKGVAVAVLAAAFLLRHAILSAGNRSAHRPRDYFRFARPR